jgi:hypothetical protein
LTLDAIVADMTSDPAQRRRSDPAVEAAWRAVPAHLVAEILDGVLRVNPRPARKHTRTSSRLGQRLARFDDPRPGDPGGWVILSARWSR